MADGGEFFLDEVGDLPLSFQVKLLQVLETKRFEGVGDNSLPPLRKRREDIPLLVGHFLARLRKAHGKDVSGLSADTLRFLVGHPWPGNVRQLKSVIQCSSDRPLTRLVTVRRL